MNWFMINGSDKMQIGKVQTEVQSKKENIFDENTLETNIETVEGGGCVEGIDRQLLITRLSVIL